jgi:ribulose-phosphate 3-epimerase
MFLSNKTCLFVSLISDNPKEYFANLEKYERLGIDGIHFDVMDGNFVPRLGLHPELLKEITSATNLPVEVHVMLDRPSRFIETLVLSGAKRLIFHLESQESIYQLLEKAREYQVELGVAINPSTQISSLSTLLPLVDAVMLMAIQPGIPKHRILSETFPRLKELRTLRDFTAPSVIIGVDGGITFANAKDLTQAGGDYLICGSGTFFDSKNDLESNIHTLLALID